jgi:hypothetical protein
MAGRVSLWTTIEKVKPEDLNSRGSTWMGMTFRIEKSGGEQKESVEVKSLTGSA